jgi:protocatechuate 3,4-dioxygenase beta subunit
MTLSSELRIRGTVVDPVGEPIESAVASAEGFYHVLPRVASRDGAEAQTTPRGEFLLRGLRSDIGHAVLVRAPGFAERIIEVPADARGDHDLGRLRLEREAVLVGVVLDPDGRPVEDIEIVLVPLESPTSPGASTRATGGPLDVEVRVHGMEERVRTSRDGTFLLERLNERPYELRVQRDNEPLVTLELEPVPGQGFPDLELGLPFHTVTMSGTVSGPDGPIADARVELERFGRVATVATDAEGRFRIAGLDDVEPYSLRVSAVCPRTGHALSGTSKAWGFEAPAVTISAR